MRQALANLREVEKLNEKEFNAGFEYMFELLSMADPEQKKKMIESAKRVYGSHFDASKFALEMWLMVNWMDKNPHEAMDVPFSTLQSAVYSTVMVSSKAVTK